jgi:hypothetical protein
VAVLWKELTEMDGGTAASSPSNKLGSSHSAPNPLLLSHHDGETGVGVGFVVALFDHAVMKGIFIAALPWCSSSVAF